MNHKPLLTDGLVQGRVTEYQYLDHILRQLMTRPGESTRESTTLFLQQIIDSPALQQEIRAQYGHALNGSNEFDLTELVRIYKEHSLSDAVTSNGVTVVAIVGISYAIANIIMILDPNTDLAAVTFLIISIIMSLLVRSIKLAPVNSLAESITAIHKRAVEAKQLAESIIASHEEARDTLIGDDIEA